MISPDHIPVITQRLLFGNPSSVKAFSTEYAFKPDSVAAFPVRFPALATAQTCDIPVILFKGRFTFSWDAIDEKYSSVTKSPFSPYCPTHKFSIVLSEISPGSLVERVTVSLSTSGRLSGLTVPQEVKATLRVLVTVVASIFR